MTNRFGKLTVVSVAVGVVTLKCDCGATVKRSKTAISHARCLGYEMQCKQCRRKLIRKKYPAPSVSLAGAFNGLERMLK